MLRTEILFLILGMAGVTFFTRYGALALLKYTGMPKWVEKWLRHVPTAILTALIVPGLLLPAGKIEVSWHNHYLMAGLIVAIMAYNRQNTFASLMVGMLAIFTMRFMGL